jgi:hypothetical protein
MAKSKVDVSIDEILGGDLPEKEQEINLDESIVDAPDGDFKLPEAPEETAKTEVSAKGLTGLEKEIAEGVAKTESDIRARAAAAPPTMEECLDLIPELKDMSDEQHRYYLLDEMEKTGDSFCSTHPNEMLAVQLSEIRNKQ